MLPYSWELSREKTFANCLLVSSPKDAMLPSLRRKLSQIAWNLREFFPFGSFPLYGNCRYDVMSCPSSSAIGMKQFFFHLLSIFGRLSIEPQLNELWIHTASQKCAGGSTWEGGCGHVDTSVFNSVKRPMWSLWLSPQSQSCSLRPWFLMSVQKWPFYNVVLEILFLLNF